jgi:tetratricopeptide (TPR) repeat protein
MRRKTTLVTLLALLATARTSPATVVFESAGFTAAQERAKQETKPLVIDFYADWCGPCKLLDATTWQDAEVGAFSKYFVSVKVDTEKGEGPELSRRFGVEGLPTILFLDPDGRPLFRQVGYMPPVLMLGAMRKALAGGDGRGLLTLAEASPQDAQLQLEAGRLSIEQKRWAEAQRFLIKAEALSPEQDKAFAGRVLLAQGELATRQGGWDQAAARYRAFVERFPDSPEAVRVRGQLAEVLARAGKREEALSQYRQAVRSEPESVPVLNGFAWFCATERLGLDEALTAAAHAVELSDHAPGVLDTLAEVRYARGEYGEALKIIAEAMERQPDDPYFRRQQEKFLTAQQAHSAAATSTPTTP